MFERILGQSVNKLLIGFNEDQFLLDRLFVKTHEVSSVYLKPSECIINYLSPPLPRRLPYAKSKRPRGRSLPM